MKTISITIILFLLSACSTMNSGQYIQVTEHDTLEELAQVYGTTKDKIILANRGKDFRVGQWFFVPQEKGFARVWNLGSGAKMHAGSLPAEAIVAGALLWPVPSSTKISSSFGKRWGKNHQGIDIPGRKGTAILAAEDGRVIYSGRRISGYGKMVVIVHQNGLRTVYAHNSKLLAKEGQKVFRGQVIAQMGSTGRSTGVHLHFEVRKGNRSVDPTAYVSPSRRMIIAKNQ